MSVLGQDPVRSLAVIRGLQDHLAPAWPVDEGRQKVSIVLVVFPLKVPGGGCRAPPYQVSEPSPGSPGALRLHWPDARPLVVDVLAAAAASPHRV